MLDFVAPGGSMIATAQDVGIFVKALSDGFRFNKQEQAIYSSVYKYGHTGLLPGYSSIARYHKDIDAVVVQFVNTSGGYTWNLSEIVYNRIVKILRRKKAPDLLTSMRQCGLNGKMRARTAPDNGFRSTSH